MPDVYRGSFQSRADLPLVPKIQPFLFLNDLGRRFLLFVLPVVATAPSLEISPSPPLALHRCPGKETVILRFTTILRWPRSSTTTHTPSMLEMYRFLFLSPRAGVNTTPYYHHYSHFFMLGKKNSAIGLLARPTAPHHHVHCRRPFDASQYSYSDSKQIRHLHPRRHNNHLTRG
jgi:hypothetical protein